MRRALQASRILGPSKCSPPGRAGTGPTCRHKVLSLARGCPSRGLSARRGCRKLRSEEHTSELQSRLHLVCRLLLEKKKKKIKTMMVDINHVVHTKYTCCST